MSEEKLVSTWDEWQAGRERKRQIMRELAASKGEPPPNYDMNKKLRPPRENGNQPPSSRHRKP